MPAAVNLSITSCAALRHSDAGNCLGSATDLQATSSARSLRASGMRAWTRSRRAAMVVAIVSLLYRRMTRSYRLESTYRR
jgi:hypothetical protein